MGSASTIRAGRARRPGEPRRSARGIGSGASGRPRAANVRTRCATLTSSGSPVRSRPSVPGSLHRSIMCRISRGWCNEFAGELLPRAVRGTGGRVAEGPRGRRPASHQARATVCRHRRRDRRQVGRLARGVHPDADHRAGPVAGDRPRDVGVVVAAVGEDAGRDVAQVGVPGEPRAGGRACEGRPRGQLDTAGDRARFTGSSSAAARRPARNPAARRPRSTSGSPGRCAASGWPRPRPGFGDDTGHGGCVAVAAARRRRVHRADPSQAPDRLPQPREAHRRSAVLPEHVLPAPDPLELRGRVDVHVPRHHLVRERPQPGEDQLDVGRHGRTARARDATRRGEPAQHVAPPPAGRRPASRRSAPPSARRTPHRTSRRRWHRAARGPLRARRRPRRRRPRRPAGAPGRGRAGSARPRRRRRRRARPAPSSGRRSGARPRAGRRGSSPGRSRTPRGRRANRLRAEPPHGGRRTAGR